MFICLVFLFVSLGPGFRVCLGVFNPLENFSLIWRWRTANFDICSAPMAIDHEQWEFLSLPHLLWHGASFYNGYLRGPVTLTPIAERLTVELSLPVFMTWVCCSWDSITQHSACGANALPIALPPRWKIKLPAIGTCMNVHKAHDI